MGAFWENMTQRWSYIYPNYHWLPVWAHCYLYKTFFETMAWYEISPGPSHFFSVQKLTCALCSPFCLIDTTSYTENNSGHAAHPWGTPLLGFVDKPLDNTQGRGGGPERARKQLLLRSHSIIRGEGVVHKKERSVKRRVCLICLNCRLYPSVSCLKA